MSLNWLWWKIKLWRTWPTQANGSIKEFSPVSLLLPVSTIVESHPHYRKFFFSQGLWVIFCAMLANSVEKTKWAHQLSWGCNVEAVIQAPGRRCSRGLSINFTLWFAYFRLLILCCMPSMCVYLKYKHADLISLQERGGVFFFPGTGKRLSPPASLLSFTY